MEANPSVLFDQEHIKTNKYQCKICNNVLSKKGHLDRHMLIHTGERKFKCDFCGKGFIQPSDVRRHERVHIGQGGYLYFILSILTKIRI